MDFESSASANSAMRAISGRLAFAYAANRHFSCFWAVAKGSWLKARWDTGRKPMFQSQGLPTGQRSENFAENVFKEPHQQASRALFYPALAVRLFELQPRCGLNDDAEGQSQSRAPEASHSSRQPIRQSSRKPTDPGLLEIKKRGAFSNSLASCRNDRAPRISTRFSSV